MSSFLYSETDNLVDNALKINHDLKRNPTTPPGRAVSYFGKSGILAAIFMATFLLSTLNSSESAARYASVVMDSRTGQIIFSRNADKKLYPASLTKIMTLYMTFEALSTGRLTLGQKLKVSARAAGQTPTKLGLKKGSRITVKDAMYGLITKSANDAATVLAEAMAPTEAEFAQKMTIRARKLGMSRTSFRNASGLPNRRQKSTARDMALLGAAMIHDFPQFYQLMSMQSFNYRGKKYKNHNNLLGKYSGADGIKTGYIRASGFNLVASAKRGSNRLIGVVFGGKSAKSRDRHMKKLLDNGFDHMDRIRPFVIPTPAQKPVNMALGLSHTGQATVRTASVVAIAPKPITPTILGPLRS
ncbi:MAG: D-alanyl-D-alanine carboxypeptidase, partial [Sneathiella sp.]|nr:D-alanyl-D-alanine carboxypeptidase [Sneathiella sp.]